MADSVEPLFKIRNVSKYFGEKKIVSNINFNIMPGEILGIIGASGSGKTTILNMLIGFLRPETGSIAFRFDHLLSFKNSQVYREVSKKQINIKKMIGFAAQTPSFYSELTIQENMKYFGSLFDLSKDALDSNIESLLNLMELKSSRYLPAKKLSGGMQRRLDIACALVHDPKVLILDEPTSDLDPILRKHIWELIRIIRSKGTTIILSSHHLTEIEHLCDRIAILKDKTFIEINTFDLIQKKYIKHKNVIIETKSKDYDNLLKNVPSNLISTKEIEQNELIISTKDPNKLITMLMHKAERLKDNIISVSLGNPNLDEIFVSIAQKDKIKPKITNEKENEEEILYSNVNEDEINLSRTSKKEEKQKKKEDKKIKIKSKNDKIINKTSDDQSTYIFK